MTGRLFLIVGPSCAGKDTGICSPPLAFSLDLKALV